MKKKILIVCTTDSMIWNFLQKHIIFWQLKGINVECACVETGFYFQELLSKGIILHRIPFQRKPIKIANITAYRELNKLVKINRYDLIVCQEPVGGVIGRMVAHKNHIKVVYTAHGFHFYKGAPLINWLTFYPIEKLMSYFTDVLVTSNEEDFNLSKKMRAKEIKKINGIGVKIDEIHGCQVDVSKKRGELNIPLDATVVLNAAELIPRKNHETAIHAIAELESKSIFYIICGDGEQLDSLKELSRSLKIEQQVLFLGFRKDLYEFYKISDIFLFPSFQEGLSVSLMMAIASNLPVVCSRIRGNVDIIENNVNGLLFAPNDTSGFVSGLELVKKLDKKKLRQYNKELIKQYGIEKVKDDFYQIVEECL